MVSREQLVQRAAVAARLNRDLANKWFHDRLVSAAPVDDEGDTVVIAAGADESAVVTIHRFEQSSKPTAALATIIDDQVRVVVMAFSPESKDAVSVPGGLTVEGWIRLMDQERNRAYNADGAEFKTEINGISLRLV